MSLRECSLIHPLENDPQVLEPYGCTGVLKALQAALTLRQPVFAFPVSAPTPTTTIFQGLEGV
eukprot:1188085-Prorocentrum_minimum.AAC.2